MSGYFFLYIRFLFLVLPLFNHSFLCSSHSAVTYELWNTRFGDSILAFLHAKWVAYKFDIPLLYKEFKYSNQLMLHQQEQKYTEEKINNYKNKITFAKDNIPTAPVNETLYIIPYFGEPIDDHVRYKDWIYLDIDWKDKNFQSIIKTCVCPIEQLSLIQIPPNMISIAVHVRTGVGFDGPELAEVFPFKCPPLEFYLAALKKIISLFDGKPLYVFIFTDHPNPKEIGEYVKNTINCPLITWGWRGQRSSTFYDQDVLEDFFSITHFNCLIRSESHFSFCASKLTDYLIEISPKTFYIAEHLL